MERGSNGIEFESTCTVIRGQKRTDVKKKTGLRDQDGNLPTFDTRKDLHMVKSLRPRKLRTILFLS